MPRGGKREGAGRPPSPVTVPKVRLKTAEKSKQSKKSKPVPELTKRQAEYMNGIVSGKNKMQAALAAGYAPSVAKNAHQKIEGPGVRAAFQKIMREWIDPDKLGQRIAEGLDAQETKFAQFEGMFTDERDIINWSERRAYAEIAATYTGYHVDKQEIEVAHDIADSDAVKRVTELFAAAAQRVARGNDASRAV